MASAIEALWKHISDLIQPEVNNNNRQVALHFLNCLLEGQVLAAFRSLHRARKDVFRGDELALTAGRTRINNEFRKHMDETDEERIDQLLTLARDSEKLLRKTVVQATQREDGMYEVRLTEDTALEENTMFDPNAKLPVKGRRKKCPDSPD